MENLLIFLPESGQNPHNCKSWQIEYIGDLAGTILRDCSPVSIY